MDDLFIPINRLNKKLFQRREPSPKAVQAGEQFIQGASGVGQKVTEAITNPGSLFVKPRLEKMGVPTGIAGVAGLALDFAAPGPGEGKKIFKGFKDLTTKGLEALKGRSTVSKQYIQDLTNQPELRQAERDLLRTQLTNQPDIVNVPAFANKVKSELLPLDRTRPAKEGFEPKFESIALPDELRGPVANYSEHVYESPIRTSAGDVHFGTQHHSNYFAHTRIEDLPDGKMRVVKKNTNRNVAAPTGDEVAMDKGGTRRVIEIQSDLFQKGRLEGEKVSDVTGRLKAAKGSVTDSKQMAEIEGEIARRDAELSKLEPYRNTWHERVIREEIKKAAKDGKTKLQFPTGETAMKIEGLGQANADNRWFIPNAEGPGRDINLTMNNLEVGKKIVNAGGSDSWIITDVLGDGKFKAVPKDKIGLREAEGLLNGENINDVRNSRYVETFDISGKVDTNNPIYKFYEKEVGRFLTNKFGAKIITDPQGVRWFELDVPKNAAKEPVLAYGKIGGGALVGGAALGAGLVAAGKPKTMSYGPTTNVQYEQLSAPSYQVRGATLSQPDVQELRKVVFSEVSNRRLEDQELETRILLNTAINRMNAYNERGRGVTLVDVLRMPNQYQGYNSPQYKLYSSNATDTPTRSKKQNIDKIVDKLIAEIEAGTFTDNTNGAYYYSHKGDKIYYDDRRPLFKGQQPFFINAKN